MKRKGRTTKERQIKEEKKSEDSSWKRGLGSHSHTHTPATQTPAKTSLQIHMDSFFPPMVFLLISQNLRRKKIYIDIFKYFLANTLPHPRYSLLLKKKKDNTAIGHLRCLCDMDHWVPFFANTSLCCSHNHVFFFHNYVYVSVYVQKLHLTS